MEQRVADLEQKSQRQDVTFLSLMKGALRDAFQFPVHQDEESQSLQVSLKLPGLIVSQTQKDN